MKNKYSFETLEEFYDNLSRGGEIEFLYNGNSYSITHPDGKIHIMGTCNDPEQFFKSSKEVGEDLIEGTKIKDMLKE